MHIPSGHLDQAKNTLDTVVVVHRNWQVFEEVARSVSRVPD